MAEDRGRHDDHPLRTFVSLRCLPFLMAHIRWHHRFLFVVPVTPHGGGTSRMAVFCYAGVWGMWCLVPCCLMGLFFLFWYNHKLVFSLFVLLVGY